MRAILDYCSGGVRRERCRRATLVLHEGGKTGHLFVLIEGMARSHQGRHHRGRASPSPARCSARCRCCSTSRIPRPCARRRDFDHLRDRRRRLVPARSAAGGAADRAAIGATPQCRNDLSRRPDASICRPRHSPLDGRRTPAEHDQPAAVAGLARFGSAIRPKDVSQGGTVWIGAAGRCSGALRSIDCAASADSQNASPSSMSSTM